MSVQIILNKNKKFEVVTVGRNGNLLDTTSPQQYNRKSGAFGKIIAVMHEYNCELKYVQDNTGKIPVVLVVYADKKRKPELTKLKPWKQYIPAKKTKKSPKI